MTTMTTVRPPVRAALERLIDYAGLFPPAQLNVPEAIGEYASAREGPYAWMLGRFIVPLARIGELGGSVDRFGLSVVVGGGELERAIDELARWRSQGAAIEAVEIRAPSIAAVAPLRHEPGVSDLPVYVELARDTAWREMLPSAAALAAQAGLALKLRCGGVTAPDFPSVAEVAAFLAAATAADVPFKATAGLHHPVRHVDAATGFPMHGFVNLIAGAALATRIEHSTLEAIVAEEDATAFAFEHDALRWRDQRISVDALEHMRTRAFVAYGSCSFSEPVDDLIALRVLPNR
jgi:hypothetical protein